MPPVSVLLVEDELTRSHLAASVRSHPGLRLAAQAATLAEAFAALEEHRPPGGAGGPHPGFRVIYDAVLVEEGVLLAERRLPPPAAAAFRAERDRIYEVDDPDEREARFEELHGRFFLQLGLDRPLHEALGERPEVLVGGA